MLRRKRTFNEENKDRNPTDLIEARIELIELSHRLIADIGRSLLFLSIDRLEVDLPVLEDVMKSLDFLFFLQRHVIHPLLNTDQLMFQDSHVIVGRSRQRYENVENDALTRQGPESRHATITRFLRH